MTRLPLLLALALPGCFRPAEAIVISAQLSPEQQEATVEALEEWFALAPEVRLPYAIHDAPKPQDTYVHEITCDEPMTHYAMTYLRIHLAPDIELCHQAPPERLRAIMLHELGHVLALRDDHTDEGIMTPIAPINHTLTSTDATYLRLHTQSARQPR